MRKHLFYLGFLLLFTCSYQFDMEITRAPQEEERHAPLLNPMNMEEALEDGFIHDVEIYLSHNPELIQKNAKAQAVMGALLVKKGRFREAITLLLKARTSTHASSAVSQKALWNLSLAYYYLNDFKAAAFYASEARRTGLLLDEGFIRFLSRGDSMDLYRRPHDAHLSLPMIYGRNNSRLPFIRVRVQGLYLNTVIDTGASMTIISSSLAEKLGIEREEELKSWGYGLHEKKISLHFAFLPSLTLGDLTIENVPIMIFPDEDLTFHSRKDVIKVQMALGYHLLRQGVMVMNYLRHLWKWDLTSRREHSAPNHDLPAPNLTMTTLRPLLHVGLQGMRGYHFIPDTGSEKTFLTTAGANRSMIQDQINFFRMIFHGFGKSRLARLKGANVTVTVDGYRALFRNIPIIREQHSIVDGYLGNDFMSNFIVTFDFPASRLSLEIPTKLFRGG